MAKADSIYYRPDFLSHERTLAVAIGHYGMMRPRLQVAFDANRLVLDATFCYSPDAAFIDAFRSRSRTVTGFLP